MSRTLTTELPPPSLAHVPDSVTPPRLKLRFATYSPLSCRYLTAISHALPNPGCPTTLCRYLTSAISPYIPLSPSVVISTLQYMASSCVRHVLILLFTTLFIDSCFCSLVEIYPSPFIFTCRTISYQSCPHFCLFPSRFPIYQFPYRSFRKLIPFLSAPLKLSFLSCSVPFQSLFQLFRALLFSLPYSLSEYPSPWHWVIRDCTRHNC